MLDNYVGQRDSLTPLTTAIEASRASGRRLPHSLFLGRPGTGKTELARATAGELDGPFVALNAATVKDAATIADAALRAVGGILFLDEIHALDRKQAESIFTLLDDGQVVLRRPIMGVGWEYRWIESEDDWPAGAPGSFYGASLYEVPVEVATRQTEEVPTILGPVTVIGATTDEAMMPPALLSRLSRLVVRLRPYNIEELADIAEGAAVDVGCAIYADATVLLAQRSRRSPRRVKQLTERASDYAVREGRRTITEADAGAALAAAGVDEHGLEEPHRQVLRILAETGGLSRTSLAQRMGLPPRNLDLPWADLTEQGFVTIGRRHEATEAGLAVVA